VTEGTPSEVRFAWLQHETVQVFHHRRKPLGLYEFDDDVWNLARCNRKQALGRATIIADIDAMHKASPTKKQPA